MTQGIIDARRAILNAFLFLKKQKDATDAEFESALDWFKEQNVPIALSSPSGRYEQVTAWPQPTLPPVSEK